MDTDLAELIAAERRELAAVLHELPAASWDQPSLCAGWRVREVVAHMTMPFRYSTARFLTELLKSRCNFTRMADRCARRDAAAEPNALLQALTTHERHPWKPPGGGLEAALTHDVIHGMDITVALGIERQIPEQRLRIVLQALTAANSLKHFGTDLTGLELRAQDMNWSFGSGTPVCGIGQDLALILCGRRLPAGRLPEGPATWVANPTPPDLPERRGHSAG
jgi:uncharacterized protein (TIGR03083 family)